MRNFLKSVFCCVILLSFTACSPITAQRGNMLKDTQVEQVVVGQSTRTNVLQILGSPTTQSTFNPNVWYYIGQETEKHSIMDSKVVVEKIVAVHFDEEGIVEYVGKPSAEREDVNYARSKTPTHGNELTFMQQLLGNMGRFNGAQR